MAKFKLSKAKMTILKYFKSGSNSRVRIEQETREEDPGREVLCVCECVSRHHWFVGQQNKDSTMQQSGGPDGTQMEGGSPPTPVSWFCIVAERPKDPQLLLLPASSIFHVDSSQQFSGEFPGLQPQMGPLSFVPLV